MKCGKQCYSTKSDANKVMRSMGKRKGAIKPKRAYYCSNCDAWHLSSRDNNPKQRRSK